MKTSKIRKIWIAANWKMNHTQSECDKFFQNFNETFKTLNIPETIQIAFFPNFLSLSYCQNKFKNKSLHFGSQNTHFEKKGAFTGEISSEMLREIDINLSLVGHSERRQYFGETNSTTFKRTNHLLAEGFTVIHCIGESKEERLNLQTNSILQKQIEEGFPPKEQLTKETASRFCIAYEPVWAIGTGLTATVEQVKEAHSTIRSLLIQRYGADIANQISLLYGGSVTPENFKAILNLEDVDGGLVGGASLKPESFLKLVQIALEG